MEKKCTLSNEELIAICEKWVFKLSESSGKDWILSVPVNFNKDPDVLFIELVDRFKHRLRFELMQKGNPNAEKEVNHG